MKLKKRTNKKNQKTKSIQIKLFTSLCIVIVLTIIFLIIINNFVLETFYVYRKRDTVKNIYEQINEKYNNSEDVQDIKHSIDRIEHFTQEMMSDVDMIEWKVK